MVSLLFVDLKMKMTPVVEENILNITSRRATSDVQYNRQPRRRTRGRVENKDGCPFDRVACPHMCRPAGTRASDPKESEHSTV